MEQVNEGKKLSVFSQYSINIIFISGFVTGLCNPSVLRTHYATLFCSSVKLSTPVIRYLSTRCSETDPEHLDSDLVIPSYL